MIPYSTQKIDEKDIIQVLKTLKSPLTQDQSLEFEQKVAKK